MNFRCGKVSSNRLIFLYLELLSCFALVKFVGLKSKLPSGKLREDVSVPEQASPCNQLTIPVFHPYRRQRLRRAYR